MTSRRRAAWTLGNVRSIYVCSSVTGPHRPMLRQFFSAEVPDELAHAQFLADKISSLGGRPTTEPRKVPAAADAHAMLENVLAAEKQAIADYKARAEQAAAFGDKGLATHEEVAVADGEDVHEGEDGGVFVDAVSRGLARDDGAEDAVAVAQWGSLRWPVAG